MKWTKNKILEVLDNCAEAFTFPVLDNGYVYLAATRLSVFKSETDWAIVIEVFGFSPRSGEPDIHVYTFSNNLNDRNASTDYVSEEAYNQYLSNNPYNESRFFYPIENNDWQDEEDLECLASSGICYVRGNGIALPSNEDCVELGIDLETDSPQTFEFFRYLAAKHRNMILCNETELRVNIQPDMLMMIQLDDWIHPDITDGELPSCSPTFITISTAIESGNFESLSQIKEGNTSWRNWPEAGTL